MIPILDANLVPLSDILAKRAAEEPDITGRVGEILQAVREEGDKALFSFTQQFDGVKLSSLRVSEDESTDACDETGEEFMALLKRAAANIYTFHKKQLRQGFAVTDKPGIVMGQKITPIERVGLYVPGGTAAYPSTVLMDAIPAKLAGVARLVMVTPPGKDGRVNPAILAAAAVAGVDEIYKVGGAQAVGALAFGTASVPKVDKIVGPGNLYVATAKRMVYGVVDIDMIAGPSDVLVVADETAKAAVVAADMLAQAEHDVLACAMLVTTSKPLAEEVQKELEKQVAKLSRAEIAEKSIRENGKIIATQDLSSAMEIANAIAPEHLELCVKDPFALLPFVKNAGSIFLGHDTPEVLGDYFAGPNHTLPTGGRARFSSPLSVDDFIKKSSYLYYSRDALLEAADDVQAFADAEGLGAHAGSVAIRVDLAKQDES